MHEAVARALGQLGATAATPEVVSALLKLLMASESSVRETAAEALGRLGAAAATPEVIATLCKYLTGSDEGAREAAAKALRSLSVYVHPQNRHEMAKLFFPLALSSDVEIRETGYVSLRNLLAGNYGEPVQT